MCRSRLIAIGGLDHAGSFCRRRLRPPILGDVCRSRPSDRGTEPPPTGKPGQSPSDVAVLRRSSARVRLAATPSGDWICRFFVGGGSVRRSSARGRTRSTHRGRSPLLQETGSSRSVCRRRLRPPIIGARADRGQLPSGDGGNARSVCRRRLRPPIRGKPHRGTEPPPTAKPGQSPSVVGGGSVRRSRHVCRSRLPSGRLADHARLFVGGGSVRRSRARAPIGGRSPLLQENPANPVRCRRRLRPPISARVPIAVNPSGDLRA